MPPRLTVRRSHRSPTITALFLVIAILVSSIPLSVLAQGGLTTQAFSAATAPNGWSVTPADGPGWSFNNPGTRTNETGAQGNVAIADSDQAGEGVSMDTALISPAFSLNGISTARLQFRTFFRPYENSTADVDVSIDGGTTWTNVWRTTTQASGLVTVNLSEQAANQSNVRLRFRYYNATWAWYWQIDDVAVTGLSAPAAPTNLNAIVNGSQVALTWSAVADATKYNVQRSADGTNWTPLTTVTGTNTNYLDAEGVACGTSYTYRVLSVNTAGSSQASNLAPATTAACPNLNELNETFTATTAPVGWTVQNNGQSDGWRFDDPGARASNLGIGTNNFAIADNLQGSAGQMNTELRSPQLNLTGRPAVKLTFGTFFFNLGNAIADVDVSTNGGATWTNTWRSNQSINNVPLRTISVDLSATAGNQSNVLLRFRLHNAQRDGLWLIDDVSLSAVGSPGAPTNLNAELDSGGAVKLSWNGGGATTFELERAVGNGGFTNIATITNGATSFIDVTVAGNTAYRYRVRARNAGGASPDSTIAQITSGDRAVRFIDMTVSYYDSAANANTKRAAIEANLRYFADAVYEMSNGANKLRRIEIHTGGAFADRADIVWIATCWPNAHVAGYGKPGLRIQHCDDFQGTSFIANDRAHINGGYTLGHEMGHYFYSIYDEYRGGDATGTWPGAPISGDTPVTNSVMHSQWNAVDGDLQWLNFSTAVNNTRNTAQQRIYGASIWETLVRPASQDPRDGNRSTAPTRLFHPELSAVAPAPNQAPRIDLVSPTARTEARNALQFVWVGDSGNLQQAGTDFVRQFMIDTSANMSATQLASIKAVLKNLVNGASAGDMIGVSTFSGSVSVIQAPLIIADQTDRDALKSAIDGIAPSSNPAVATGDALEAALTSLNGAGVPAASTRVVYLFGAGVHTEGGHPFDQVGPYQNAAVPIYSFDLGSDDLLSTELFDLADATGGAYFTGASIIDLRLAFSAADQAASPAVDTNLATGAGVANNPTPYTTTFYVDASIGVLQLDIIFTGDAEDATITLNRPNGTLSGVPFTTFSESNGVTGLSTLASARIANPDVGEWTFTVTPVPATEADLDLAFWVDAETKPNARTFVAAVTAVTGEQITYPEPIVIEAFVGQDFAIAGAGVRGEVEAPDGSVTPVTLTDNGSAPDFLANDGYYSAIVPYRGNGEYVVSVYFDNAAGNAVFTEEAVAPSLSPNPDGRTRPAETYPVEGNFQRYATATVFVRGSQADDHADDITGATPIQPDNIAIPGWIDFANDFDVFRLDVPTDYTDELILRVANLGLGMDPYVFAFAEDESWELEQFLETEPTNNDFLTMTLPPSAGKTVYIVVLHYTETAEEGLYDLSVGPALVNETNVQSGLKQSTRTTLYLPLIAR